MDFAKKELYITGLKVRRLGPYREKAMIKEVCMFPMTLFTALLGLSLLSIVLTSLGFLTLMLLTGKSTSRKLARRAPGLQADIQHEVITFTADETVSIKDVVGNP